MDLASILGYSSGIFFIIMTILLAVKFNLALLIGYADAPSVMCTIGGTIASTLIAYPLARLTSAFKAVKHVLKSSKYDPGQIIENIIALANVARKEGILALEEAALNMDDQFLKKGIMLIVDGTDPELVRNILETELSYIETRHKEIQGTWEFMASMGPAWGMIGTLIGLVNMLNSMSDPASLGPNMAVALITTFYGTILANYICTPTANKLKIVGGEEILLKEVMIEGMLSIQAGENPRIIEEKLKSFLAPAIRDNIGAKDGDRV